MLNGFNDLEALDLCVHFDFPENLGVDMMGQCDSFLDDILQPSVRIWLFTQHFLKFNLL